MGLPGSGYFWQAQRRHRTVHFADHAQPFEPIFAELAIRQFYPSLPH
jgi:hypothetical protein